MKSEPRLRRKIRIRRLGGKLAALAVIGGALWLSFLRCRDFARLFAREDYQLGSSSGLYFAVR